MTIDADVLIQEQAARLERLQKFAAFKKKLDKLAVEYGFKDFEDFQIFEASLEQSSATKPKTNTPKTKIGKAKGKRSTKRVDDATRVAIIKAIKNGETGPAIVDKYVVSPSWLAKFKKKNGLTKR